jgi:very-short-patch-repair endonuclease
MGIKMKVVAVKIPLFLKGVTLKAAGYLSVKNLYYNHNLKEPARKLRKAGILHEVLLWQQIKNKKINGLNFTRQRTIGNYIVDFYNASNKIAIETDGHSHDNEKQQNKDAVRDRYLNALGIKIIRILAKDILQNMEGVIKFLTEETRSNTPSGGKVSRHPF